MLSQEDNRALCEVEPGTLMHEAFKRYWLPCGLSSDLPGPDSDPIRVTLLCEDYVMFRDSSGRIAVMRELCCHRGASLCLGRVEEGGIRCIYHGWKFAADGTILDMPNCDDDRFKTRYRQPAFPVREAGGIIWTYLGAAENQPPFPHYPFFDVPDDHRLIEIPVFEGNYVQVMEGGLDSSHLGVLHSDVLEGSDVSNGANRQVRSDVAMVLSRQKAPRLEIEDMEGGFRYAAIRDVVHDDGRIRSIARVTAFALPSVCFIAPDNTMLFALPVTSGCTHFYHIFWNWDQPFTNESRLEHRRTFGLDVRGLEWGLGREYHEGPNAARKENNFQQNRAAMRSGKSFTGILNFVPEDAAVTASPGPIYDRAYENLVPADMAVARVRRVLLENARSIRGGEQPRGLDPETLPRPAMGEVGAGRRWQDIPYRQESNRALAD